MATYIPGLEDKLPQSQPFVPDYKFLSDVLQVRQDRYDKNYQQLNNVYGKVVHADLTRNENKYVRDQYAKQLAPQVKQISGLDLSLQENVDAAYGLFKPFYDNENIMKDLTATTTLKQQRRKAESFKNSPIKAVREKYWDYGMQGLKIWEDQFKNADQRKAMSMGLPQYVEDVDLAEQAMMLLEDSGLGDVEDVIISQDNKWIIKQKSGSLITAAPTGRIIKVQDKNGKEIEVPETKNLALEYVSERLADDPKVQSAYHLRNFVDMTNFVKENSERLGGEDNAKKEWANTTIKNYTPKMENEIVTLDQMKNEKEVTVKSWESYAKDIGIKPGSEQDIDFIKSLDELKILDETINSKKSKLETVTAPTSDLKDLLTKAYTVAMGHQMGSDMLQSASAYALKTMTREQELNPEWKMWAEHQYRKQEILLKDRLEQLRKSQENVTTTPKVPLLRRTSGNEATTGGNVDLATSNIEGDPEVSDFIGIQYDEQLDVMEKLMQQRKEIIKQMYLLNAPKLGLESSSFTPIFSRDLMSGNGDFIPGEIPEEKTSTTPEGNPNLIPPDVTEYENIKSMSWSEFNQLNDYDLIHNMYMGMKHMIDNAENKLPSYATLPADLKIKVQSDMNNLKGDMSFFTEKNDEFKSKLMDVQKMLVGTDSEFEEAAVDGGSIFDNNGILINKEEWVNRYVEKWNELTTQQMNNEILEARKESPNAYRAMDYGADGMYDMSVGYGAYMAMPFDFPGTDLGTDSAPDPQMNIGTDDIMQGYGKYWEIFQNEVKNADNYPVPFQDLRRRGDMQGDAEKYYDYMYNKINSTVTSNAENSEKFGFNFSAAMEGMPMMGDDMYSSPTYTFQYDHASDADFNGGAVDFFNNLIATIDGDAGTFSVVGGKQYIAGEDEVLGSVDQNLMQVLNEAYFDITSNYGNPDNAPKKDGINFSITYSKNGGGDKLDAALYEITFPQEWAEKYIEKRNASNQKTSGIVPRTNQFTNDYTITVLVEKELDNNIYKTGNMTEQRIMAELRSSDGRITRAVPDGGQITVFEVSPGVYMYEDWYWNVSSDGSREKVTLTNMQIPQTQIANVLATQEAKLNEIATSNQEIMKAINLTNNNMLE
tara:strand:+ start:522 stop:3839 length:3318 start_codon:yes stop_codon:yes gene_type:complete